MTSATQGTVAKGEPKAWVKMPGEAEMRGRFEDHPYNFGFVPAMGRLASAHPRFGSPLAQLYSEIMFSPESVLTREEREMIACAASTAQDCFY